jgi:hypothetical protein
MDDRPKAQSQEHSYCTSHFHRKVYDFLEERDTKNISTMLHFKMGL